MSSSCVRNAREQEQEELEEQEEEEWLELGLGFVPSATCRKQQDRVYVSAEKCSSSSEVRAEKEEKLGLDLELRLGFHDERNDSNLSQSRRSDRAQHGQEGDEDGDSARRSSWSSRNISNIFVTVHDRKMMLITNNSHNYSVPASPRLPRSGFWFTLRSSINWRGEVFPQIPRTYIRVRDENVTIFIVKKYLIVKLGLSHIAQINITCMGQSLSQFQTLKEVKDEVWLPGLVEFLNSTIAASEEHSHGSSLYHLMPLQYAPHCVFH